MLKNCFGNPKRNKYIEFLDMFYISWKTSITLTLDL